MTIVVFIELEPSSSEANYYFPLDCKPTTDEVMESAASLAWDARFARDSDIRHATLKSGGKMRDLTARVYVQVGTATPDGKADFGDKPKWGYFSYRDDAEVQVRAQLHVSERMFAKLVELATHGTVPTLFVSVADDEGIETLLPDGYLGEWDNVNVPNLEIIWCEFTVALPRNTSERPQ